MGQIKNIKLHIVTDIKFTMPGVTYEPYAQAEALGSKTLGELPGFLIRNAAPSKIWQRMANWRHRVHSRYGQVANRPGVRFPLVALAAMVCVLSERRFCGTFSKGCCRSPKTLRNSMNCWIMIMCYLVCDSILVVAGC